MKLLYQLPFVIDIILKKLYALVICFFVLRAAAQQKLNTFHIVDSKTNKAAPFVSVTILRARLAITTEEDGIFIIPGNISAMRDTVVFSAQNYVPLKQPLSALAFGDTVRLTRNEVETSILMQK